MNVNNDARSQERHDVVSMGQAKAPGESQAPRTGSESTSTLTDPELQDAIK
jgi:hypothetical protein